MPYNETKNILGDKEYEGKKSVLVDRIRIRNPYWKLNDLSLCWVTTIEVSVTSPGVREIRQLNFA